MSFCKSKIKYINNFANSLKESDFIVFQAFDSE